MADLKDSSLQPQNPVSQAQQSVEKLHHAVNQAQTHPTEQMIEQAENALEKAERSVAQADGHTHNNGLELAREMLAEEKADLERLP
jgi:multidrug resistance efflux pump